MPSTYQTSRRGRRGKRPEYNPIHDRAKAVADELYYRAKQIAETLAPDNPQDTEEMEPEDIWYLLEQVALEVSPEFWDDPDAIDDLIRLRSQFAPNVASDYLKPIATAVRKSRNALPDIGVTPADPEYDRMLARMKRGGR